MNSNFRNVDIKRAVSKYVGITPFDDTILDVVKGLSNKEVSNDESLKRVYWSDVTMFKQHFLCRYPDIFIPNSNLKNLDQNSLLIFRIFSLQIDFSGRLTYIWLGSIYIHISIHSLLRSISYFILFLFRLAAESKFQNFGDTKGDKGNFAEVSQRMSTT